MNAPTGCQKCDVQRKKGEADEVDCLGRDCLVHPLSPDCPSRDVGIVLYRKQGFCLFVVIHDRNEETDEAKSHFSDRIYIVGCDVPREDNTR